MQKQRSTTDWWLLWILAVFAFLFLTIYLK